jgi:hypothetical protein
MLRSTGIGVTNQNKSQGLDTDTPSLFALHICTRIPKCCNTMNVDTASLCPKFLCLPIMPCPAGQVVSTTEFGRLQRSTEERSYSALLYSSDILTRFRIINDHGANTTTTRTPSIRLRTVLGSFLRCDVVKHLDRDRTPRSTAANHMASAWSGGIQYISSNLHELAQTAPDVSWTWPRSTTPNKESQLAIDTRLKVVIGSASHTILRCALQEWSKM